MAREDAAQRLKDVIPELEGLKLELAEYRLEGGEPLVRHSRIVVVDRAPALFRFVCGDSDCDGSHDITGELMRGLRARQTEVTGETICRGRLRTADCQRKLVFTAHASYEG